MKFRFVDLPIRWKFLLTLAIPVLGLVTLIGKQVVGSIDRQNVLTYFRNQSVYLGALTNVIDALQTERALSYSAHYNKAVAADWIRAYHYTDSLLTDLSDPVNPLSAEIEATELRARVQDLRNDELANAISLSSMMERYETIDQELLKELERVGKLALYPDTKDRLYAHLSLVSAKEALNTMKFRVNEILLSDSGLLDESIGRESATFETSITLFERDASPDILTAYHERFDTERMTMLRSILATIKQRNGAGRVQMSSEEWLTIMSSALANLGDVEKNSLSEIIADNNNLLRNAKIRLWLTIVALFLVITSVAVLGMLLTRAIRNTVSEIGKASQALALGDVRGKVPVRAQDEFGQLAEVFNSMMDNIRSLSRSADAIGKGNYDTPVTVRSKDDVLGLALSRMKDNLRAARIKEEEQNRILQDEKEKLELANENVKVLIKEIHHRVKNNLQVIVSLLRLQSMNITDPELQEAFEQTQQRVRSMALIHEKLYQGTDLAQVDVAKYLEELFTELVQVNDVADRVAYETNIPAGFELDLHTMVPIGLMMNELISNSFKHAFKGRETGKVQFSIAELSEGRYEIIYSDDGVGLPSDFDPEDPKTLGVVLIDGLVEQLSGELKQESDEGGTTYRIQFSTA